MARCSSRKGICDPCFLFLARATHLARIHRDPPRWASATVHVGLQYATILWALFCHQPLHSLVVSLFAFFTASSNLDAVAREPTHSSPRSANSSVLRFLCMRKDDIVTLVHHIGICSIARRQSSGSAMFRGSRRALLLFLPCYEGEMRNRTNSWNTYSY